MNNQQKSYNDYLKEMKELADWEGDFEDSHYSADRLIVEFLSDYGFKELSESYDLVGKWYA
jgi:hypothetical protein